MCVTIPMRVLEVGPYEARCEALGAERRVSLLMMPGPEPKVGEFVGVQMGYAVARMTEADAEAALGLLSEMARLSPSHHASPEGATPHPTERPEGDEGLGR